MANGKCQMAKRDAETCACTGKDQDVCRDHPELRPTYCKLGGQSAKLTLTVPGIPPSVNHYKKPRFNGAGGNFRRRGGFYLTPEATSFQNTVALLACDRRARETVERWAAAIPERHRRYRVALTIYLGKGQRGDRDNFRKVPLDALVKAKIIHSDARVTDDPVTLERDWANPRTVIVVEAYDERP